MKHAFSNMIKVFVGKLLAYVVSTFCKDVTKRYSESNTITRLSELLLEISEHCITTVETLAEARNSSELISHEGGKEND